MKLFEAVMQVFRKPEGFLGTLMGRDMNIGHMRLYKWVLSLINIREMKRILDIGCGGGRFINLLARSILKGKVYGIDYSKTMVELSRKINIDFIEKGIIEVRYASVSSLPFSDNTFDLITAIESFYFWPDIANSLKEIFRVLNLGGSLILVNELHNHKGINPIYLKFLEKTKVPLHTPKQLKRFFSEAGYSNIKIFTKKSQIIIKGTKIK